MVAAEPDRVARIGRWIDRGLAHESSRQLGALVRARRRYERACAALQTLLSEEPAARVPLARARMNLANLAGRTETALADYDRALALLAAETHPAAQNMRGAAWLNRGARLLRSEPPRLEEAAHCFDEAIAVLGALTPDSVYIRRNLAAAWMNRAATHALAGNDSLAAPAATRCLIFISPLEAADLASAEIGLKARLLWLAQAPGERSPAEISAASDVVDQGLALGRTWLEQGGESLQPWVQSLYRAGGELYLKHLPQFLPEYLREHLLGARAADFVDHLLGNELATRARQAVHARQLTTPSAASAPQMRELGHLLDELAATQERLFRGTVEGTWLRARRHELAGRPESARLEWLRHQQERPTDQRARQAARDWPTHRGSIERR